MLEVGSRVAVKRDLNLGLTIVEEGEVGKITAQNFNGDDKWGDETWVTLERFHPGLTEYGNAMWIDHREYRPRDVIEALPEHRSCFRRVVMLVVLNAAISLGGAYLLDQHLHLGFNHGSDQHASDAVGQTAPHIDARIKIPQSDGSSSPHDAPAVHAHFFTCLPLPGTECGGPSGTGWSGPDRNVPAFEGYRPNEPASGTGFRFG